MSCEHLDQLEADERGQLGVAGTTPDGCEECLAEGTQWVKLRRCLACGHVGCCDSSVGKHATAHNASTGHLVMQSFEPGEDWLWCYEHEEMGRAPDGLPPSPAHS